MSELKMKAMIGEVFSELATALETGKLGSSPKVAVTVLGSEHGPSEIIRGAMLAQSQNPHLTVCLIGPQNESGLLTFEANDEAEQHAQMEQLLDSKQIDACVTMHYNFPIGVSTVGRVITPGRGKEMILATTTGTSATDRVEAMIRNAISGIATAKAIGITKPTVGVLNVDGSRQVERALNKLMEQGYAMQWSESVRADGGAVMRGNDLLLGAPDVMVTDTLTGNLLMKVFSSFNSGGDYEASGYGYGPGVGENYPRTILILSRASGAPVVASALKYAGELVEGSLQPTAVAEYNAAYKAGMQAIFDDIKASSQSAAPAVTAPPKKVVTAEIVGIDVMQLEEASQKLWAVGIYAESGMGCVGPVVLVAPEDEERATEELRKAGYF